MIGKKDDKDKDRWDLLPWRATWDVVRVLTFGADKYGAENWRHVEGYKARYHAAALRHLYRWARGERYDPESNLPHLAHAACCLLFIADIEALEHDAFLRGERS